MDIRWRAGWFFNRAGDQAMTERRMRMMFLTREDFPTQRVDVDILFGREILRRGHIVYLVAQAASKATPPGRQPWHSGTAYVGRTVSMGGFTGKVLKQLLGFGHDVRWLLRARQRDVDAIQVRDKFLIAVLGIVVARIKGLQFYYWLSFPMPEGDLLHARSGNARNPAINYLRGWLTGWLLYRLIARRSDFLFVQSERLKDMLCARGADPARVMPVPMGVDNGYLESPGMRPRRPEGAGLTLGYLGTLDANRHLEVLIDMLGLLVAAGVVARLLLIGDAGERRDREALRRRAESRRVSTLVEMTGFLPHGAALERMRGADIGLSPIHPSPIFRVGSPTKLVEYMALGLPVVANAHPEQKQILAASGAGVCVPWGARYFARGVRWLARRQRGELEAIGQRGREWVMANRSYEKIAHDLERQYLALLAGTRKPASQPIMR
jgi:glycosyltransferase involved in cell wall biosynthesis